MHPPRNFSRRRVVIRHCLRRTRPSEDLAQCQHVQLPGQSRRRRVPRIMECEAGQPGAIAGAAKQRIDRLPADAEHQDIIPPAHRLDQAPRALFQRHQSRTGFCHRQTHMVGVDAVPRQSADFTGAHPRPQREQEHPRHRAANGIKVFAVESDDDRFDIRFSSHLYPSQKDAILDTIDRELEEMNNGERIIRWSDLKTLSK